MNTQFIVYYSMLESLVEFCVILSDFFDSFMQLALESNSSIRGYIFIYQDHKSTKTALEPISV